MAETHDTSSGIPPFDEGQPGSTQSDGAGKAGGVDVQGMLGQLQGMISKVAAASEPRLRDVAAKAAELAAVAAERAGPLAHTLAEKTDQVGHTVADRAQEFASSLRAANRGETAEESGAEAPTGLIDGPSVTDPAEDSPRDGA